MRKKQQHQAQQPGTQLMPAATLPGSAPLAVMEDIEQAHYIVTDDMVRRLARLYVQGEQYLNAVRGSYLRILLAAVQTEAKKAKMKRLVNSAALRLIGECHGRLYAVVLDEVSTEDVRTGAELGVEENRRRSLERNRRSNFARSAKSTLVKWIRKGGRVSDLDVGKVTKSALTVESEREGVGALDKIERLGGELVRLLEEVAKADRGRAGELADDIRTRLALAVAKPLVRESVRVKDITLHPERHRMN